MWSTSGAKIDGLPQSLSRKMTRIRRGAPVDDPEEEGIDSEKLVPRSLAEIVPILRVAIEIKHRYPRVAYLCLFHAFEKAHKMDPMSTGRGVRQFKTYLMHRLEKEEKDTKPSLAGNDPGEIQKFYQMFYEQRVRDGQYEEKTEVMAKNYRIASVLYDVVRAVVPYEKVDAQINKCARVVEIKKEQYVHYNIIPLFATASKPAIKELPEIEAAINALRKVDHLPKPRAQSTPNELDDRDIVIHDLLDWLWLAFGFQKGNVANQREHLILLLANADIKNKQQEDYCQDRQLDNDTVKNLKDKILENYFSWCNYLHCEQNVKITCNAAERQPLQLLYIGLYLLIWGEASNIRFMPECICYIFHHMAKELDGILHGGTFLPAHQGKEAFLREVVTPIYQVLRKEAERNQGGTVSHSKWRNYDDLNEYFWSDKCLKLGWPMNREADFFLHSDEIQPRNVVFIHQPNNVTAGKRKPKTNFVEVRTFWHLYRSFYRLWVFLILVFQAMVIVAWSAGGSLSSLFDEDVFRNIMSIFITYSLLNFLKAMLDIILSCRTWGSLKQTQIIWYLLKFAVASLWVVVLPIGYSSSVQNPTGLIRFFSDWTNNWQIQSFYNFSVVIFMTPNIFSAILFILPPLRRSMENSNLSVIVLMMWWTQPKLYVGRSLHEDFSSLLKYTLFWILLLISKLAFSYYVEILPLIGPTKLIIGLKTVRYNIGGVISIWAPIVLVYFMDAQIWYAIFSTIFGGIHGVFNHMGEIRTLRMLRSAFEAVPVAFSKCLVPLPIEDVRRIHLDGSFEKRNIAKFAHMWNEFINCMRMEDLLSNRERDLLLVPYSSSDVSVVQWPIFLLASNSISVVMDMVRDFKWISDKRDNDIFNKVKSDDYMKSAVIECYETLRDILYGILGDDEDKMLVRHICYEVDSSIQDQRFLQEFRMSELPEFCDELKIFLNYLEADPEDAESNKTQIMVALTVVMDFITKDVMVNGHKIMERAYARTEDNDKQEQRFGKINLDLMQNKSWMEKVVRIHLLLTVRESAIDVPMNLEARRRITFFTNSLFMKMPDAPKVRNMLSFSVLTPYYKEDVHYSEEELEKENEDGISILFYLRNIYPDEWSNFQERLMDPKTCDAAKDKMDLTRQWVSYRGQTLSRTVRGMMYYRQALELQCFLDMAGDHKIFGGYRAVDVNNREERALAPNSQAVVDMKFTYVVSCQIYGQLKISSEPRDRSCYQNILNLMLQYPSLRVAYIDEREETVNGKPEKVYYSVLIKGGDNLDEEIYRIKLPGLPTVIGEGKPENQNHAIIFTRGEALQTMDMNQEFLRCRPGQQKPSILGLREHISTGSVSSLAWFMSNQETSFVTIGQRTLANPLRVRFHYGHPDIFDRIFHLTRGGISKASKTINLSEYIFSGFNSTLRGGNVTHHEYIQAGRWLAVGMNQISLFEAQVANGNGEQTLSRDVYRLGHHFDFYRMLSFYFTTVGFYFSSMVTVIIVYVFLYGRLYLVLSGLERSILLDPSVQPIKSLEMALATQSVYQLGLLLVLPMVTEIALEGGFLTALGEFIIMQLQLASVFFTFQLGTKAHYYGRTILHGGAKYRATDRGFVVFHAKFADNYRLYSRSHFVKGMELLMLLIVYEVYGKSYSLSIYWFITSSMWFLVASWLFAPFVFNPSGFEWQKTVDDWTDWKRWMGNHGGICIPQDRSWESWWESELEHLKRTDIRGQVLEIILACRFFVYQYGIVYRLNIAHQNQSLQVYGLSWLVMAMVLLFLKMVSMGRRKFGTNFQLMFRILKFVLFLCFLPVMTVLFVACGLTTGDLFAVVLCFMPTGWALLLIGQACRSMMKGIGFWDIIKELARGYEYVMGMIIFMPIVILSWFRFVSKLQTNLLFNQTFGSLHKAIRERRDRRERVVQGPVSCGGQ
ncbi:callose synthase 7-like isoform X2 [Macadamia integrifolia]|uniref:callose synthase 7-like isoform X2 n=1 Tax=Macadamia integrifolia TaxID=60698 RepID=UPI001C4E65BC|nr:callose synthase 7-like isoform X2 [Macadamia integrifolia]